MRNRTFYAALSLIFLIGVLHAQQLEIKGGIKIEDGTEGPGKVLTSDIDGHATWTDQTQTLIQVVQYLPGGIQALLSGGLSPKSLLDAGVPADSLIGKFAEGGYIFFIDTDDIHPFDGLVAAPEDQSTGTAWGCSGTLINGADGTAIGSGAQNTLDILTECSTSGIAADLCAALTLGGYDDWFLPSQDELNEMFYEIGKGEGANVVVFTNAQYWSSGELANEFALTFDFDHGIRSDAIKTENLSVRAIRAF